MTTASEPIETTITAFLDGDDSLEIDNIIHSTEGAAQFGFTAPLVGGVTVYAWAIAALIEALGEAWLSRGWIDVRFRRPVYPGDEMTTRVVPLDSGDGVEFAMAKESGEVCLAGTAGLGDAAFLGDLAVAQRRDPAAAADPPAMLTPEILPVGEDVPPMTAPISTAEAAEYADQLARDQHPRWRGDNALVHPGWIAGRCTRLLRHTYNYEAAIHAGSLIQQFAPIRAGQTLVVCGHMTDGYQRKDHEYCLLDVTISSESGEDLARIRHRTIYQVAAR